MLDEIFWEQFDMQDLNTLPAWLVSELSPVGSPEKLLESFLSSVPEGAKLCLLDKCKVLHSLPSMFHSLRRTSNFASLVARVFSGCSAIEADVLRVSMLLCSRCTL